MWRASLASPQLGIDDDARLLTGEEEDRANSFRSTTDAARFIVARATLRRFLGEYLAEPPERVVIEGTAPEKPYVAGGPGVPDVRFNIAHAGPLGLFAFALGRELGVDCELRSSRGTIEGALSKAATPAEQQTLDGMPPERRAEEALRLWTRKEAILKGMGTGLRTPPESLEIGVAATVSRPQLVTAEGRPWTLFDLPGLPDAYGSLALEGQGAPAPKLFLRK